MARQDHGAASAGGQAPDDIAHLDDSHRVQPVGRLVEDQQRRVAQQGASDAQALLHAGGAGAELAAGRVAAQVDGVQQVLDLRVAAFRAVYPLQALQVVPAGQVGPEDGALDQRSNVMQRLRLSGRTVVPEQSHRPVGGVDEAGQHGEQGGLARPVGAQQSEHAPGGYVQAYAIHRRDPAEPLGQARH